MAYKIKYYKEVSLDILDAKQWYKLQLNGLEKRFANEVKIAINKLKIFPTGYAIRFENLRIINLKIFPYCIYFYVE